MTIQNEFSRPVAIDKVDPKVGLKKTIAPTSAEMNALAARFDLQSIGNLTADVIVKQMNDRLTYHVTGILRAEITQESVISKEPVTSMVEQEIEAWFEDQGRIASFEQAKRAREDDHEDERELGEDRDNPEIITNGFIDIGEVAAQCLGIAIDDFPRTEAEKTEPADHIEVDPEKTKDNPFAALEKLKS